MDLAKTKAWLNNVDHGAFENNFKLSLNEQKKSTSFEIKNHTRERFFLSVYHFKS